MPNQEALTFGTESLSPQVMVQETIFSLEKIFNEAKKVSKVDWNLNQGLGLDITTDEGNFSVSWGKNMFGRTKLSIRRKSDPTFVVEYKKPGKPSLFLQHSSVARKAKAKLDRFPDKDLALGLSKMRAQMTRNLKEIKISGLDNQGEYQAVPLTQNQVEFISYDLNEHITKSMQGQIGQGADKTPKAQTI
jgi:hypothetical protein